RSAVATAPLRGEEGRLEPCAGRRREWWHPSFVDPRLGGVVRQSGRAARAGGGGGLPPGLPQGGGGGGGGVGAGREARGDERAAAVGHASGAVRSGGGVVQVEDGRWA